MKPILFALVAACGATPSAPANTQNTASVPLQEQAPEQSLCAKAQACSLIRDSADEMGYCLTCAGWIGNMLEQGGYDWKPYADQISKASCEDLKTLGHMYRFFGCVYDQHTAHDRLVHGAGE